MNRTNRVRSTSSSSSNKNFYYSDGEEETRPHDNDDDENSRPMSEKEDADMRFSNLLRRPRPISFPYSLNEPPDDFAGYL
jgi:hypothetical protein